MLALRQNYYVSDVEFSCKKPIVIYTQELHCNEDMIKVLVITNIDTKEIGNLEETATNHGDMILVLPMK